MSAVAFEHEVFLKLILLRFELCGLVRSASMATSLVKITPTCPVSAGMHRNGIPLRKPLLCPRHLLKIRCSDLYLSLRLLIPQKVSILLKYLKTVIMFLKQLKIQSQMWLRNRYPTRLMARFLTLSFQILLLFLSQKRKRS